MDVAECWLAAQRCGPEAADDDSAAAASLLITGLTANAVLHGRVKARNAHLALTLVPATLRIDITDARDRHQPVPTPATDADGESGRGLLLVASLADAWRCEPYPPGSKTVQAERTRRALLRTCLGSPNGPGTTSVSR
ncbi:ATP-binding protein [Streptomyces sp. NPDC085946]|uniref:ATP-binding protein n=1 Tax=Streptomyces sp. NPDC085946 TaxID=3365744 RepID=UPI0037CE7217